jgi:hypothetical protein
MHLQAEWAMNRINKQLTGLTPCLQGNKRGLRKFVCVLYCTGAIISPSVYPNCQLEFEGKPVQATELYVAMCLSDAFDPQ